MSKTKATTKGADKGSKALNKVKDSGVTKASQSPAAKNKVVARKVAAKEEKAQRKNKKKEPTPSSSESESDSDEEMDSSSSSESEEEKPAPKKNAKDTKKPAKKEESSSESESDSDEDMKDASSSESESESEEEKPAPKKDAKKPAAKAESSSESESESASESESESESEDEKPAKKEVKKTAAKDDSSDSSDSDSDSSESEDEAPAKAKDAKKSKKESSDSSDSDSSESGSDSDSESEDSEETAKSSKKRKADEEPAASAKKSKTEAPEGASANLFVGNLSWNVDEEWLQREFAEFGELAGVRVVTDRESGRSRGFGYVEFASAADAAQAFEAKKGAELDGRAINLDYAAARQSNNQQGGQDRAQARARSFGDQTSPESETLFVGNLPFSATEDALHELFGSSGGVQGIRLPTEQETGRPKGFGYVQFSSVDEARQAFTDLQGHELEGRALRLDYSTPRPNNGERGGRGGFGGRGGGRGGFGGRGGGRGGGGRGGGGRGGFGGRGGGINKGKGSIPEYKGTKVTF
ncbi:Nucleolin protein Nsr1 [Penicillium alfredii]|uniref:Nucleolin protein Nsr1 n=1 Tax=Penicillium alfredii TaxID=1506179 RepID=A0A9W9GB52_9EURO|nr:Nucleolin protein Nsr1 [Penicillium alfredii]KAJ5114862.1 Nucleolin protein Nsr1 [Penicillium alfredii]